MFTLVDRVARACIDGALRFHAGHRAVVIIGLDSLLLIAITYLVVLFSDRRDLDDRMWTMLVAMSALTASIPAFALFQFLCSVRL